MQIDKNLNHIIIMKKILFALLAVGFVASLSSCKKESKEPSDMKDAEVVSTIPQGDEMVGEEVEMQSDGDVTAEAVVVEDSAAAAQAEPEAAAVLAGDNK